MSKGRVTPKNLAAVLLKLGELILKEDPKGQRQFCNDIDHFLDELMAEDAFGTEGQLDPRGDQRD